MNLSAHLRRLCLKKLLLLLLDKQMMKNLEMQNSVYGDFLLGNNIFCFLNALTIN